MVDTTGYEWQDGRWAVMRPTIRLVGLCIGIAASCLVHDCQARERTYLFHGYFAPTDRAATPAATYSSPSELMGRPFTVSVTWPSNAEAYSSDWQTGADYHGSYTSAAISLNVDVPGFEFSVPPTSASWETWNDTVLEYRYGVPQMWGDELRLVHRVDWTRTHEFTSVIERPAALRDVHLGDRLPPLLACD